MGERESWERVVEGWVDCRLVDGREWWMGGSGRWEGVVDRRQWYMSESGRWQIVADDKEW